MLLHQSGRKLLERVTNFAAHFILQSSISPVHLLRHKLSFEVKAVSFALPYAVLKKRLSAYLRTIMLPLDSFKSGLQI